MLIPTVFDKNLFKYDNKYYAGYGLAASPIAFDPMILGLSTLGVGLTSAAANAVNQTMEVPFDSQMNRTRNRVLVKG